MRTLLLVMLGAGLAIAALTFVRVIRCRTFPDKFGGSNYECRVVWR